MDLDIRLDDLRGAEIAAFLAQHLQDMRSVSPPESVHALDLDALRQAAICFWTVWSGRRLVGCGALKALDAEHAELKSMRTASEYRRSGIASRLLSFMIDEARHGFTSCAPFDRYCDDPNSIFMTRSI